jgi:hypothetical protein
MHCLKQAPEGQKLHQAHLIVAYFCDYYPYFLQLLKYSPPGLNFKELSTPGIAHDVASKLIAAKRAPEGHRRHQKPI